MLLERNGTPDLRHNRPVAWAALVCSGVPNAGAPDRMSTLEVKPPQTTGQPGLTAWGTVKLALDLGIEAQYVALGTAHDPNLLGDS